MDWNKPFFMVFSFVDIDISFFEIDITYSGKTQFRNTHSTGVKDSEKDRYNITAVWAGIRHRFAFINCIKKALKFLICIDMCIISYPLFCDSLGWNICRNTYIVEISAENTHDTDAACLIRSGFVSPFSAP